VPYALAINPATNHLFVNFAEVNQLGVFDANTFALLATLPLGAQGDGGGEAMVVLNNRVYVSNYAAGTVSVISDSCSQLTPTPTPTKTLSPTSTSTRTVTPSPTASSTPPPTSTPTPSATPSPTAMATPTPGPITLHAGWNLISVPKGSSYQAATLVADIAAQGGNVSEISRWSLGTWQSYLTGYPFNNFDVLPGWGYLIRADVASTWVPASGAGASPVLNLSAGWNFVGAPYCPNNAPSCHTMATFAAAIIAQGGSVIEIDDWQYGSWNAFVVGYPFHANDPVQSGRAYFIRVTSASVWRP
jgi:hypothetical protein